MNIKKMKEEMKKLESRINDLKDRMKEIQHSCDHHYNGNDYYQICSKCDKVNVLYY